MMRGVSWFWSCRMKEYLDLVRLVMEHGVRKPSRTGVDTLSYFGAFYRVNLARGFPLLTTKKVNFNACLHELLWYLSGEEHIRNLRKVTKIWDAWADEKGDLETAYGRYWRRFPHAVQTGHGPVAEGGGEMARVEEIDQIQYVIDEIRRNPFSRRLVVVAGGGSAGGCVAFVSSSSTSKIKVEFGGIPRLPCSP